MAKKVRRRNSRGSGFLLLIIFLALAVAGGFFYASGKDAAKKNIEDVKQKVQSTDLDLRGRSKSAHDALDSIFASKTSWRITDNDVIERKEERADKKGSILWTERKLSVGVPAAEDLESAATLITGKAKAENLFVITRKNTSYAGSKAIVLEVAIYGKAGTQEVTCVTDTLTIYNATKEKKYSGNLAVIVDDCGYDLAPVKKLSELPIKMSFAILPFKANSSAALDVIQNNGKEAMLHLPMEPVDASAASESRMVTVAMTKDEVQAYTKEAVNSLPGIAGVNNHQGSKATSNRSTMKAVLEVLKSEGLFFIDSNTYSKSIGDQAAEELGVATARNQKFLDNSSDVDDIKKNIWAAAEMADRNGVAVVICHARPNTAKAWSEVYSSLKDSGIKFVNASSIVH
ncbi:MAG: divergent polysaccharide deacetylase family protein [Acidaminococcaceae bacterium]